MRFQKAEFTSNLITGLAGVDKQHAEYVTRLNNFIDKCNSGINQDEVFKALEFLESYAALHFESEEDLMKAKEYPGIEKQREQHGYFTDKIFELDKQLKEKDGFNLENLEKLYNLVYGWFINHIKSEDMKLAEYIHSM